MGFVTSNQVGRICDNRARVAERSTEQSREGHAYYNANTIHTAQMPPMYVTGLNWTQKMHWHQCLLRRGAWKMSVGAMVQEHHYNLNLMSVR